MVVIIVIVVVLAAGVYTYMFSPSKPELSVLRIGYQPSWHHTSEFVMVEKGWFEKVTGLKLEEKCFPTGPPEMEAFIAGELDIAYVGATPPLTALAKGLKAKIVAIANTEGSALVVRPDFSYTGPTSLKGAKIGCYPPGSIQDTILKHWLEKHNINPGDVKIIAMGPTEQLEALRAGALDGIFAPDPTPYMAVVGGYGKIVAYSSEMWPHHPCCVLLMSENLINNHRETAVKFLAIHIITQEYISNPENKADVVKIIIKRLDIPKEVAEMFPGATKFEVDPFNPQWLEGIDAMCKVQYDLEYTKTAEGKLVLLKSSDIVYTELYTEALKLVPELKKELGLST
ncbi:MAG: ABC transporter substrate-binding protein [Candidatus Bathyarchaeota archaeon]